ncbi:acyltransferase Pun1-like [Prosopis cineraria]|uniref:acyltransferase Pun1-like n=1 Tax=Prosopis cineraria TaxID=364024 RepID=UPI00240EBC15|nr:acyltransferase Pun1-like [Prosopis cineraria]
MDMEVISREAIKPSSPTPPHLRIYPLSFIDHVFFSHYVPVVYFFEPTNTEERSDEVVKKSLSQVLALYYPLAGRIRDRASIECNDEGATLLVTHIKCDLSGFLRNPLKEEHLNMLFPDELPWKKVDPRGPLFAVQVNHFVCRGMAISVCVSHKVADGNTIFNFVQDWATITRKFESSDDKKEGEETVIIPRFDVASIFPLGDLPSYPELDIPKDNIICKRFILDASLIQSPKAMISQKVKNPTRVQVASALLYKSAVSALSSSFKSPINQPTRLCSWANLRTRMSPPVYEKTIGNLI